MVRDEDYNSHDPLHDPAEPLPRSRSFGILIGGKCIQSGLCFKRSLIHSEPRQCVNGRDVSSVQCVSRFIELIPGLLPVFGYSFLPANCVPCFLWITLVKTLFFCCS